MKKYLATLLGKLHGYLTTSFGFYTSLFVFISVLAWYKNATDNTRFNLDQLKDIYMFVVGQLTLKYGIDSGLNSQLFKPVNGNNNTVVTTVISPQHSQQDNKSVSKSGEEIIK